MKKYLRDYLFLFAGSGIIIAIDQWTKALVRANIPENTSWVPWDWLAPYARILHVSNTGVAFGMFKGIGWLFAVFAVLVILAILFYFPRVDRKDLTLRIAMCLQMAGAAGNLIDRILQNGRVTDFVSIGNFAIWNVADASITLGVVVLLIGLWLQERKSKADAGKIETANTDKPVEQPQEDGETQNE